MATRTYTWEQHRDDDHASQPANDLACPYCYENHIGIFRNSDGEIDSESVSDRDCDGVPNRYNETRRIERLYPDPRWTNARRAFLNLSNDG